MDSNASSNIKITHKWSIESYADFYYRADECSSFIQSDSFQISSTAKEKFNFFIRLYPEGINREANNDYISLFLHLQDGDANEIDTVKCTFSILDRNDNTCNIKSTKERLNKYSELGFDQFCLNDNRYLIKNKYFKAKSTLTLICEIEIPIDNLTTYNGLHSKAPNSLEHLEIITTTESKSDASLSVIKHNYQWTIPQYDFIYQRNICSASHNFSLKDKEDVNFFLRLWPNGKSCNDGTESDKYLALFLYLSDCVTHNGIKALSRFSVRDLENSKVHHSRWIYGKLFGSYGLGCERFLEIERAIELLRENELDIHCEVELFCEENTNNDKENLDENLLKENQKSKIVKIKNSTFNKCLLNIESTNTSKDIALK